MITDDEIRRAKTSDLIAMLNPEVAAQALDDMPIAQAKVELQRIMLAVGAEIDRRIPIPAPDTPTPTGG